MKTEILGFGGERIVKPDPQHPEHRVLKEARDAREAPPNDLRATFYLTKILHLLLPHNVPDLHRAELQTNTLTVERKSLGADHALLNEEIRRYDQDEDVPEEFQQRVALIKQKILSDKRTKNLISAFRDLGVVSDATAVNFGEDAEGHIIYVDSFEPWIKRKDGSIKLGFDTHALARAIDELPDESQRDIGLRWLQRLNEIVSEEERAQVHRAA